MPSNPILYCNLLLGPTPCTQRQQNNIINCRHIGCFITQCTVEGDFIPKQCDDLTGDCWCVNEDGVTTINTRVSLARADLLTCEVESVADTKCERRRQRQLRGCGTNVACFVLSCERDGSFMPKQCLADGTCYCVDKNGDERPGKRVGGDLDCRVLNQLEATPSKQTTDGREPTTDAVVSSTLSPTRPTSHVIQSTSRAYTKEPTLFPMGDSCYQISCSFGATCVDGQCICDILCGRKRDKVCGTDGQTYRNPCELSRIGCLQMRRVGVHHEGRCGSRVEPTTVVQSVTERTTDRPPVRHPAVLVSSCSLPPETGLCRAYIPQYFFNRTSGQCESFVYGGCDGNENRFEEFHECQEVCGGPDACIVTRERLVYEDASDAVYGVPNAKPSHIAPTCHHDIVLLIDKAVTNPDTTTVARQIAKQLSNDLAKATSQCPNPQVRFGLVRLSFARNSNSYAHIQLSPDETCLGTLSQLRLALKNINLFGGDKIVSPRTDTIQRALTDTLDSCGLCTTDHCGCFRHFILIANRSAETHPFGDAVHNTLRDGHVFLHSVVDAGLTNGNIGYNRDKQYQAAGKDFVEINQNPSWPTNRYAEMALQTEGSVWEFDRSGDKSLQSALVEFVVTLPKRLQHGCHMCECQGSVLQCCYLYGRTKGTCKLGCEFGEDYMVLSDDPPRARSITVPPADNSICEIVIIVEETSPSKAAIDWISTDAFCKLTNSLRDKKVCSGGIKFGLFGFGGEGREGRCGHQITFGINSERVWGSCGELQAAAKSNLKFDNRMVRGDIYCALDSVIDQYYWIADSYKVVIVAALSTRNDREKDIDIDSLGVGFRDLGVTLAVVVNTSFTPVDTRMGSPFGIANAGLKDAYTINPTNNSMYIGTSIGSSKPVAGLPGTELAQLAYNMKHGRQYGSAWSFNELVRSMSENRGSVFDEAFVESLSDSLHTAGAVCVECRCVGVGIECQAVDGESLSTCLPVY